MIFLTGVAGFIGYHLAIDLLKRGETIIGFDSINDYYDVDIKYDRLKNLGVEQHEAERLHVHTRSSTHDNFIFIRGQLENFELLESLFKKYPILKVVNLAAQAGVRYSLSNPKAYIDSNIVGFCNVLEVCRHYDIQHLVYASSSSVYGLNETMPLSTRHNVDHPVSLYAATKKSNELMAHTYSHLFGLPTTGLRFFTVYGPWGRPDMALFLFTDAMLKGEPIKVFNHGKMVRDFTYVGDIVEGICRVLRTIPQGDSSWSGNSPDPQSSPAPWRVYNIGNNNPVRLLDFIDAIEENLGLKAERIMMDIQPGDVPATFADVDDLFKDTGYRPKTSLEEGVKRFVDWYRDYYKLSV